MEFEFEFGIRNSVNLVTIQFVPDPVGRAASQHGAGDARAEAQTGEVHARVM